ncbi:MAG: metal-dependent transcriptional regulator [Lachnospiraceae bacterium]|nr:metal-dependent transcriptional regulator [Lachnospiraceae bacterium]MBO7514186.1 metal-dependent transcriptional regulator [Lachnospiraceae bacterium]
MVLTATNNSAEDYLKYILILQSRNGCVRAVDLAAELGVTKPSVSAAMKRLREKRLVYINENGHICLTEAGRAIAEEINSKHELIKHFLMNIGVNEKTAAKEACSIEHAIGEETFARLGEFCSKQRIGS